MLPSRSLFNVRSFLQKERPTLESEPIGLVKGHAFAESAVMSCTKFQRSGYLHNLVVRNPMFQSFNVKSLNVRDEKVNQSVPIPSRARGIARRNIAVKLRTDSDYPSLMRLLIEIAAK